VHRYQHHLLRQFLKQCASSVSLNPIPELRERVVIELIFTTINRTKHFANRLSFT
jgi:hypothetical protein